MASFMQKMIAATMLEEFTKPKKCGQMTNEEYQKEYKRWHEKKEKAESLFLADLVFNKGRVSDAMVDVVRDKVPASKILLGSGEGSYTESGSSSTDWVGYVVCFVAILFALAVFG